MCGTRGDSLYRRDETKKPLPLFQMPFVGRLSHGYSAAVAASFLVSFSEYTSKTPTAVATTIGPRTTPSAPNTAIPPRTLMNTSSPFNEERPPKSTGRKILSIVDPNPPHTPTSRSARAPGPVENNQIAATIQTRQAPPTGRH